jgi:hypothetical protein
MNLHVTDLTPTQRECIQRSQNFRALIAARAADLADRKANEALQALRVAALETPLCQTPSLQSVTMKDVPAEPDPLAQNWFEVLPAEPKRSDYPPIRNIQRAVCKHYGVTMIDMLSARRTANIVLPRQVAVYLCKELTPHSYPHIGGRFGGRDHSTGIHSVQKINRMINSDEQFAAVISLLIAQLGATCA